MLRTESNVILLDEPTNDLDVDTLRALEEALAEFAGCVVVISHDRWFLDRLATHILAFEGDSHVEWFEGNFQAYEEDKRRRLGAESTEPHRIKYRPLAGKPGQALARSMAPSWTIHTGRLILTPVGWQDIGELCALKTDPRVYALMLGGVRTQMQVAAELAEGHPVLGATRRRHVDGPRPRGHHGRADRPA